MALTAHPAVTTTKAGIIRFDDVRLGVGINNLSSYKSTGKFICEKGGLYLISASIFSKDNDARYYVYLNGNEISNTENGYSSSPPSSLANTGTVVLALQLTLNDSLWVSFLNNYYIEHGLWSTLTIVKLK